MDYYWLLPSILFLLFLFCVSAFFSAAESSLTSVSHGRIRILANQGDWRAAVVEKVLLTKDRLIGAILLGNNTANTLAAAVSTAVMIKLFGDAGIYYATIAITLLVLIFCEVLPKTYALYHADRVARWLAPIVHILVIVTTPITRCVAAIVRGILWLFGERIDTAHPVSDVNELRGAIELHQGPGDDVRERRDMLRSIMDLTELTVADIMIHRRHVNRVNFGQATADAVNEIMTYNHTRIPLWSGTPENIIGIAHVKQVLFALHEAGGDTASVDLLALMNRPWFIPNTTRLIDQLKAFRHRREHFAVVVDEYGTFMGIVTLEDILEVIVGDIQDEEDLMVPGLRKMPDGGYLVNGDLSLRELNRQLGWRLPEDQDYTTLAGLVIYESRTIPEVGKSFYFYGHQFDIVKRQRHQISVIKVGPMAA